MNREIKFKIWDNAKKKFLLSDLDVIGNIYEGDVKKYE